ncbi:MAG: hypothetical protein EKK55_01855 [Rhodocyclaceae bacterium]|nr:MAG: hypothetical protein EKK55_01855 [Rhodocyclaceae bacterium]
MNATTTVTTVVTRNGESIELAVTVAKVPAEKRKHFTSGWAYEVAGVTLAGAPWADKLTIREEYPVVKRAFQALNAAPAVAA